MLSITCLRQWRVVQWIIMCDLIASIHMNKEFIQKINVMSWWIFVCKMFHAERILCKSNEWTWKTFEIYFWLIYSMPMHIEAINFIIQFLNVILLGIWDSYFQSKYFLPCYAFRSKQSFIHLRLEQLFITGYVPII